MSGVKCQVSNVPFFSHKEVELVGGGSVINRAYPVYRVAQKNLHWLQVVLMRASQCLLFRNNFLEFGIKMCATVASFLGHPVVLINVAITLS